MTPTPALNSTDGEEGCKKGPSPPLPPAPSPPGKAQTARACSRLSYHQAEGGESSFPGQGAMHKLPNQTSSAEGHHSSPLSSLLLALSPDSGQRSHHASCIWQQKQGDANKASVPGKHSTAPQRLQCNAGITAALNFCPMEYGISSLEIRLRLLRNLRIGIYQLFSTGKNTVTKAQVEGASEGKAEKTHHIIP